MRSQKHISNPFLVCISLQNQCEEVLKLIYQYSKYIQCRGVSILRHNIFDSQESNKTTNCVVDCDGLIYSIRDLNQYEFGKRNAPNDVIEVRNQNGNVIRNIPVWGEVIDMKIFENVLYVLRFQNDDDKDEYTIIMREEKKWNIQFVMSLANTFITCFDVLENYFSIVTYNNDKIPFIQLISKKGRLEKVFELEANYVFDSISFYKDMFVLHGQRTKKKTSTNIFVYNLLGHLVFDLRSYCAQVSTPFGSFCISDVNELFVTNMNNKIFVFSLQNFAYLREFDLPNNLCFENTFEEHIIAILPQGRLLIALESSQLIME